MQPKKFQRGMSIWSASFVIGVFAFIVFLIFKLFPPYMESFKVKNALNSVTKSTEIGSMSKADISTALAKRFDIDNIDTVDPVKHLFIDSRGRNTRAIRITYEVVVPLFYNVSLLLDFEYAREVRGTE